jgi:glycosyltransferase involved in cell wall biosynthesis
MRLLLTADAVGGVWQYATDLACGLSALGVETVLAAMGPPPSREQRETARSIAGVTLVETRLPLDWLAEDPEDIAAAGRTLCELADRHTVDLVQLNAAAFGAETAFGCPVIAVAHSCVGTWWRATKACEPDGPFRWRSELTGRGLARADHVVAPTTAFAEATKTVHRLRDLPTTVHNGRAPSPLKPTAPHDFAFTAGRLWDKGKNVATLDRAAARLPFPLHAAGPLAAPSGDRIGLQHIHALGLLSDGDIASWLAARPVFVSAALYEPFGLAVLEAAAAGCPLVLSDIPTFRELWQGAATFVPPMDDDGFAEAISLIVRDDLARAEMGRQAQLRAADFSVEAMAGKMARLYRYVLGQTGSGAGQAQVVAA